ncbi:flavin-containing monooxygenase [Streptomyces sp. cg36]|uniref:flavin-containing monooxygenase n=1 Tax=Streptomyces sp. cg36 TaxID=3238798 RepID=UPI0034E21BA2
MTPDHEILVVGAGISGIGTGAALLRAGLIDFLIIERSHDIGGTWRDNTYPDVAVDLPSFVYQFSYELYPHWTRLFPKGSEVKQYIDHMADKYGLRGHIRLNSEMTSRQWDEKEHLWHVRLADGCTLTARFVLTAVGLYTEPLRPDIAGLDDFTGKVIQSARWDHAHDLTGERAAVIGTGASAVQLIPKVAEAVGRLTVFQRSAIWVFPKPDPPIPRWLRGLLARVPLVNAALRTISSAVVEMLLVGIFLLGKPGAVIARFAAALVRVYLRTQVPDPALRRKLIPDYKFLCKRPSVSNAYFRTYTRPNVELVTTGIARITSKGVLGSDGRLHEIDTLILATGFRLFYDPENYRKVPVRGRDGFDLAEFFTHQRVQAYEGVSLPKLPNHFFIFGPYSWSGGSWPGMVETLSTHAIRVITETRRRGATAVEVTQEANDRFLRFARERIGKSLVYTNDCAGSNTFFLDHHGDSPLWRPTTASAAKRAARTFSLDDYIYTTRQ